MRAISIRYRGHHIVIVAGHHDSLRVCRLRAMAILRARVAGAGLRRQQDAMLHCWTQTVRDDDGKPIRGPLRRVDDGGGRI